MKNYDELKSMVEEGNLEIIYVISPMRTLSTVVLPWMAPILDGYTSEPFHPFERDSVDDGFRNILKTVIAAKEESNKRKVVIAAKDMSHLITPEIFDLLGAITSHYVFTLREPYLQAGSAIKQFERDRTRDGSLNAKEEAEELYIKYNRPAYRQLEHYRNQLTNTKATITLIEAFGLKAAPEDVLKALSLRVKKPIDKSRDGWADLPGNLDRAGWNQRVAETRKVEPISLKDDKPPSPDSFGASVRKFILEEALPVYVRFVSDNHLIGKLDVRNLDTTLYVGGQKLEDINPIAAYTMILLELTTSRKGPKEGIKERILRNNPMYVEEFGVIDGVVKDLGDKLNQGRLKK